MDTLEVASVLVSELPGSRPDSGLPGTGKRHHPLKPNAWKWILFLHKPGDGPLPCLLEGGGPSLQKGLHPFRKRKESNPITNTRSSTLAGTSFFHCRMVARTPTRQVHPTSSGNDLRAHEADIRGPGTGPGHLQLLGPP